MRHDKQQATSGQTKPTRLLRVRGVSIGFALASAFLFHLLGFDFSFGRANQTNLGVFERKSRDLVVVQNRNISCNCVSHSSAQHPLRFIIIRLFRLIIA